MGTQNADLEKKARRILDALDKRHPGARLFLDFGSPFELLIVTILAAQARDEAINEIGPVLFKRFPDPKALAAAPDAELQQIIKRSGTFRRKAKLIKDVSARFVEEHDGKVPDSMEDLVKLPGVGRKTASIVLANAFGVPAVAVDTHVLRVSQRLGLTHSEKPDDVESDLCAVIPRERWIGATKAIGTHGRRICVARKPKCPECPITKWCDYYASL